MVRRANTVDFERSSWGRQAVQTTCLPCWPNIDHGLWWTTVEVSIISCDGWTFRTSLLPVGRVVCQGVQRPGAPVPVAPRPAPRYDGAERSNLQPQRPDQTRPAQYLHQLDRSSARFPEQLDELLHDEGWVEQVQLLPMDELVEVVEYINDVRLV